MTITHTVFTTNVFLKPISVRMITPFKPVMGKQQIRGIAIHRFPRDHVTTKRWSFEGIGDGHVEAKQKIFKSVASRAGVHESVVTNSKRFNLVLAQIIPSEAGAVGVFSSSIRDQDALGRKNERRKATEEDEAVGR